MATSVNQDYSVGIGGNTLRYSVNASRSGSTLTIHSVKLTPQWYLDGMTSGWNFKIWVDGNEVKGWSTGSNWTIGSTTVAYKESVTLFQNISTQTDASKSIKVKVGCESMMYNGSVKNATISFTLDKSQVIPGTPSITVSVGDSDGAWNYSYDGISYKVYKAIKSNGTDNNLYLSTARTSNATKMQVYCQYCSDSSGGWKDLTNSPVTHGDSCGFSFAATSDKRFNNKHIRFRSYAVATSSTGDTKSSGYTYFIINDIPTISGSITTDVSKTSNSVKVTWPAMTDNANNNNKKYKIYIDKYDTVSKTYKEFKDFTVTNPSENNKTFNLSTYSINRGEKVKIYIKPGDSQDWGKKYGGLVVTRNSLPYFEGTAKLTTSADSTSYNYVFSGNVNLSWNSAKDSERDGITYYIYRRYKKTSDSSWSTWAYINETTSTKLENINANNYTDVGGSVQFGIRAYDGLEYSTSSDQAMSLTSNIIKRNKKPDKPSNFAIIASGHIDGESYYETSEKITWDKVVAFNNKDCSKYRIDYEICTSSSFTGQITTGGADVTKNEFKFNFANTVPRGSYIRFKIKAIDIFGTESGVYTSSVYSRNNQPTNPTNFRCTSTKLNVYNTMNLAWDASTDADSNPGIYYKIWSRANNNGYSLITTNKITGTSYNYDISKLAPGTTLGFKIRAYDKYDIACPNDVFITNNDKLVINTPPSKPKLVAPKNTAPIYDPRPRILFDIPNEKDSDSVSAYITVNNVAYNSSTSSAFNKTTYSSGDKLVFVPPTNLNSGSNTIKIKLYDGYQYSEEESYTINYTPSELLVINDSNAEPITAEKYNTLKLMMNNTLKAYGQTSSGSYTPVKNETKIDYKIYNDLWTKIYALNNWINNNYSGLNRVKTKPDIAFKKIISKEVYNKILDVITNI